jgi:hypothetical protein
VDRLIAIGSTRPHQELVDLRVATNVQDEVNAWLTRDVAKDGTRDLLADDAPAAPAELWTATQARLVIGRP